MSKRDELERLPEPMESLLEGWPVPERDEAFWEDGAKAVEGRLEGAKAEADDHAALLEAPLPKTDEDEASDSEPPVSEAQPRSLLELAKASLDSGELKSDPRAIAKESLSLANQARASAPAIAEATRARAAELAAEAARQSAPPPPRDSVAPSQAAPVTDLAQARAQRSSTGPLVMAVVAVLGIAAAAMIVVRARSNADAPLAAAPTAEATLPSAAAATATAEKVAANDPDIFSIEDLGDQKAAKAPAEGLGTKGGMGATKAPPSVGAGAPTPTAEPKPPELAKKTEAKPDKEEDLKLKPAATASDLPDKPSTGAVQAAIGQVLGGARACVAGQEAPSRATVTFGSDGRVRSVSVSGPAQGTPSEACIRAALSKARVQPFARSTFSVGATIRP